jgi:CBS domain-containing protein
MPKKKSPRPATPRAMRSGAAKSRAVKDRAAKTRRATPPPKRRILRAADLMTREPITVSEEMSIADLCDLFQEKNINGAPVVDRRGRLVGVVAQDDIIYGAMGHPDPVPPAAPAGATAGGDAPGRAGVGAPGPGPTLHRSRRVIARLRERTLSALPDVAPRPGERPFWADQRAASDPLRMPVKAIMTSPAISAEEATPIADLCHVMWNLRIHRVPIVRGGHVTGLISSMDLCRAILTGLIKV